MKFIVFEGLDGSGKSTQIDLLKAYLKEHKTAFQYLHFPRTGAPVYGELISMFLRGEFGGLESVHPYLVALIYAGDRHDAKETIQKWLSQKKLVITDRYMYSNIAFQCAKTSNIKESTVLKNWIRKMEYDYFNIPKPDLSIFLDVPLGFTKQSLSAERKGKDRNYLRGKKDIHEQDLVFQKKVRDVYLSLAKEDKKFVTIPCSTSGKKMLPKEKIFQNILSVLKEHRIVK